MNPMEMAKRIAASSASGGGNWIKQGSGVLIVGKLVFDGRPRFYNGDTFVAELYVEESHDMPGAVDLDGKTPELANAPGTTVSFVQPFEGDAKEVAPGKVKAFLMGLWGLEADAGITEAVFTQAFAHSIDAANPLRGSRVRYSTYLKNSGGRNGKPVKRLTLVNWSPWAKDQSAEQLAHGVAVMEGRG